MAALERLSSCPPEDLARLQWTVQFYGEWLSLREDVRQTLASDDAREDADRGEFDIEPYMAFDERVEGEEKEEVHAPE